MRREQNVSCLYLVRHAHSFWTPDETRPLSPAGMGDALRVAEILAPVHPEAIYSSPYFRARQTVEPLAGKLGMTVLEVPDLRERTLSYVPVDDWEAALERSWRDFSFALPGGESSAAAQRRAVAAFRQIAENHPMSPVALATHGNMLALLMNYYDSSVGFEEWKALSMPDIYRVSLTTLEEAHFERLWA